MHHVWAAHGLHAYSFIYIYMYIYIDMNMYIYIYMHTYKEYDAIVQRLHMGCDLMMQ